MKRRTTFLSILTVLVFSIIPLQQTYATGGIDFSHLVQWKGSGAPVYLPEGVGGDVVAAGTPCYEVDMINPTTGWRIGTGYDCITNPGSLVDTGEGTVTTYYIFSFGRLGSIISENRVVVRSAADDDAENPSSTPFNAEMTHILGSFPPDNTIVGGTRRFHDISGKVRVSGAVSLANFPATIIFDDLFVIDAN